MHNTNKKGFTLIELLVVVAIIGILSTIGLVALNGARGKARDAKRASDIRQYALSFQSFIDGNGTSAYDITTGSDSDCDTFPGSAADCDLLQTFFGGNYPQDPGPAATAVCVPNTAAPICSGYTDLDCATAAGWALTVGPCKYTIAWSDNETAVTAQTGFGIMAYFEAGVANVGGKGAHILREDGTYK